MRQNVVNGYDKYIVLPFPSPYPSISDTLTYSHPSVLLATDTRHNDVRQPGCCTSLPGDIQALPALPPLPRLRTSIHGTYDHSRSRSSRSIST